MVSFLVNIAATLKGINVLRLAPKERSGGNTADIKRDLSGEQLAGIGAVVVAWNEIEFMLDVALYSGEELKATCLQEDLPRRRLDEKIRQASKAAVRWNLPTSILKSIELSADAFSKLKDLRNAVAHSRVFDARTGIGHRVTAKGEIQEVLLTAEALEWLYQQLLLLCFELRCLLAIFDLVRTTECAEKAGLIKVGQVDPMPEVGDWHSMLDKASKDRQGLGPAPSFPL